jgi:hypothetical protein
MPDDAPMISAVSGSGEGTVGMGRRRGRGCIDSARVRQRRHSTDMIWRKSPPSRGVMKACARQRATTHLKPDRRSGSR